MSRTHHIERSGDNSGYTTHTKHLVLSSYQSSAYKERFRGGNFGFAYVGRYSSGINFRHHSVIILDGGCTVHCFSHLTLLSNYRTDVPVIRIEGIGGKQLLSVGRGDLILDLFSNGRRVKFTIADVYYIP